MEHIKFFAMPGSPDIGRLVQDQLFPIQQQFAACCPGTLSELRTVVDELSAISETCNAVMKNVENRGTEDNAAAAFKEIEHALGWTKFLRNVKIDPIPTERTLLFRAHRHTCPGQVSGYKPQKRNVLFNDQFRQHHSVRTFLESMARHLGKTQEEKRTGKKLDTIFTSMSPILEWSLHKTGRKAEESDDNEQASLVIFDLERLSEALGVTVFRVSDVLRFLEGRNEAYLIDSTIQQWAKNCDEYVTMGAALELGFVRSIPWSDLALMPIVNHEFTRTYTLARYREWRDEWMHTYRTLEENEVCESVVESAKALAGEGPTNLESVRCVVKLILRPGVRFWGINTDSLAKEIGVGCERMLRDELVGRMGQLSIGT